MPEVLAIENGAFYYCEELTAKIPCDIRRIGTDAFCHVNKVQGTKATNNKLVLGNYISAIGENAFNNVTNLESVIITTENFLGDHMIDKIFPEKTTVYCKKIVMFGNVEVIRKHVLQKSS